MKSKTINIRTKTGWEKAQNVQKDICDRCGDRLWIAPDGKTIYCNGKWTECVEKKFYFEEVK